MRAQWTRGENVSHDPGEQWIIELETGEQHPRGTSEAFDIAQPLLDYTTPDGYAVQGASHPRRDDPGRNLHDLEVKILAPESQNPVLMFDAFETAPAGDGHVVAATPVDGTTTNIFLIDIESGAAEFIATAPVTSGIAWSLDANDDYIVWADDVCQFAEPGRFSIYDRRSGAITQVTTERSPAVSLTPDGSIALGALGVEALVSPTTLMYEAVFPSVAPGWSSDMRYASIGQWTKAFGLCA